jgi:hypothetical protein
MLAMMGEKKRETRKKKATTTAAGRWRGKKGRGGEGGKRWSAVGERTQGRGQEGE